VASHFFWAPAAPALAAPARLRYLQETAIPQRARRPFLLALQYNPRTRSHPAASFSNTFTVALNITDVLTFNAHFGLDSPPPRAPTSTITMSAEQAAAQAAVAAANTPQQPQGTPQQTASTPASVVNSSGDQLVCQWQSCGERLPSAEQLYVSQVAVPQSTGCFIESRVVTN
jgi:hypothetical protein